MNGIDISTYQKNVNYKEAAKNVGFAIIRENDYNGGKPAGLDDMFFEHVRGCQEAGIRIHGIYHFGYEFDCEAVREAARLAVQRAKEAGLGPETYIWYDFEYDSIDKAKDRGIALGNTEINLFTVTFCEAVDDLGYKTGIYCNNDWYGRYHPDVIAKYPVWLADYTGGPDHSCMIQQTGYEQIPGIKGDVDYNICWCPDCEEELIPIEGEDLEPVRSRAEILRIMRSWVGKNEADGSHKSIIDLYNSLLPHPRGYKLSYTDSWCAATVSAAAIALGYTDIIPVECGCERMVEKAQGMGIWQENDAYVPSPADIIMYDWQDNGVGDCVGWSDHVGYVEKVENGMITLIEGNYKDSVARRTIKVNDRYIRGFICPKYNDDELIDDMQPEPNNNFVSMAQIHLNNFVRAGLVADGIRGSKTNTALRKAVQYALNLDFNAGLVVDGIIGVKTKNVLKRALVRSGSVGYLVTALEIALTLEGYAVPVASPGSAGSLLNLHVRDYQKKHGLEVDGEAGYNTFMSLLA